MSEFPAAVVNDVRLGTLTPQRPASPVASRSAGVAHASEAEVYDVGQNIVGISHNNHEPKNLARQRRKTVRQARDNHYEVMILRTIQYPDGRRVSRLLPLHDMAFVGL